MKQTKTRKVRRSRARPGAVKGRPSKFTPDLTQKLRDYFADAAPKTLAGFAKLNGVSSNALFVWANAKNPDGSLKHPAFGQAYAAMRVRKPEAKP